MSACLHHMGGKPSTSRCPHFQRRKLLAGESSLSLLQSYIKRDHPPSPKISFLQPQSFWPPGLFRRRRRTFNHSPFQTSICDRDILSLSSALLLRSKASLPVRDSIVSTTPERPLSNHTLSTTYTLHQSSIKHFCSL
jgi:hypothetical protein